METPGDRIVKQFKKWLKDYSQTKFAIPTIIALSCLIYYFVVTTLYAVCFGNMIPPLFMLALLWMSGVKRVKKLLLIGLVAVMFFAMILTVVIVTTVQHVDPVEAKSIDGKLTGTLDPLYVDKGVPFTFRLTADLTDSNATVNSANIRLIGIGVADSSDDNLTMNPDPGPHFSYDVTVNDVTTHHTMFNFSYTGTTSKPINQYIFKVDVNGTWTTAGDLAEDNSLFYIQGPIYKDSFAVAGPAVMTAIQIDIFYVFMPYAIILGMIWWTRRARRMREKQVEKWQAEQAELDKAKPKPVSKVPSMDAAMGKTDEGFVCSECGADVPADATVCPKCGEKFE